VNFELIGNKLQVFPHKLLRTFLFEVGAIPATEYIYRYDTTP